jgi:hypothetical protein
MAKLIGLLIGAVIVFFFELLLIKWAVSLFYPITWTQAFGISLILSIIGAAFRSRK